jgi:hypothetical protein
MYERHGSQWWLTGCRDVQVEVQRPDLFTRWYWIAGTEGNKATSGGTFGFAS